MAVLLAGPYGSGNPGDEARLLSFADALGPEQLLVTSRAPAATARSVGCDTVPPTPSALASAIRQVDAVVVGGGTMFVPPGVRRHDAPLANIADIATLVWAARAREIPVALVGVGATPMRGRTSRILARRVVNMADLLILRDARSAVALAAAAAPAPFRVGADPAWSLVSLDRPPHIGGSAILVALSQVAPRDLAPRLAEALSPLAEAGWSVDLQPWESAPSANSQRMAADIAAHLGHAARIVPPSGSFAESVSALAEYRLVVGFRVNTLVAATAAGTASVAIAQEPGVVATARSIGQRSVPGHAPAGILAKTIALGVEQRPPERETVELATKRAAEAHQLVRLLLNQTTAHTVADLRELVLTSGSGIV